MPLITVNGITLSYEWIDDRPDAPALILLAGALEGCSFWRRLTPLLHDRFRVVTLDSRGVGLTEAPDAGFTVEQLAADVLGLIDALGIERPHVLGHSLGSAVALELGRSQPDRIGKVVMVAGMYPGPAMVMPTSSATALLINRGGDERERVARDVAARTAPGFQDDQPEVFASIVEERLTRITQPRTYMRQTRAGLSYIATDRLSDRFRPPLCLVYGAQDAVVQPANGERIRAKVPDAPLHVIEGAGHLLPLERPDALAAILTAFLG